MQSEYLHYVYKIFINKKRIKDLWQFASIKLVHKREFEA